jgi:hypothetical protein
MLLPHLQYQYKPKCRYTIFNIGHQIIKIQFKPTKCLQYLKIGQNFFSINGHRLTLNVKLQNENYVGNVSDGKTLDSPKLGD